MIRQALGCVVVFGCLMASASLQAHHSTAGVYDPAKEGEVTGTLSQAPVRESARIDNDYGEERRRHDDRLDVHDRFGYGARRARDHQSRPERAQDRRTVDCDVHAGTERESIGSPQDRLSGRTARS